VCGQFLFFLFFCGKQPHAFQLWFLHQDGGMPTFLSHRSCKWFMFLKLLIKSSLFWLYCSDSYRFFCPHTFESKIESNHNLQFSKWVDSVKDVSWFVSLFELSCLFINRTVLVGHCFRLWFSYKKELKFMNWTTLIAFLFVFACRIKTTQ